MVIRSFFVQLIRMIEDSFYQALYQNPTCDCYNDYLLYPVQLMTPNYHEPLQLRNSSPFSTTKKDLFGSSIKERSYPQLQEFQSLKKLRVIQDSIFQQAQEAWEVLNETNSLRVDGRTYEDINSSSDLQKELERVRANAPIYQNWNTRKKNLFFTNLGSMYNTRLNQTPNYPEDIKSFENISETLETVQTEQPNVKKSGKKIAKNWRNYQTPLKKISLLNEGQISCESLGRVTKKVCFQEESAFKYFSKAEPPESVVAEQQYSCLTFDKK